MRCAEAGMNLQFPLEVLVRNRALPSQKGFAEAALRTLDEEDDAVLPQPRHDGLALLAAHELALERPTRALHAFYGDVLEIRAPRVRYMRGRPLHEPVMHVRIEVRHEHRLGVMQELKARGARILEECSRPRRFIVRAEAPLAMLIGLPALLAVTTGDSAAIDMRLVRYAPLPPRR